VVALDRLYVVDRIGRWQAASRAAANRRNDALWPFLDHRLVRAALEVDPLWRRSEEVVYELIGLLAPKLRDLPLEGDPWRFKRRSTPGWWRRAAKLLPRTATPATGWDWRKWPGDELRAVLGTLVLERLDVLAPIVEPDAARALLAKSGELPTQVWHLATVATMLGGAWPGPEPAELPPVRVPVPR
jgi:hypothetical protein